MLKKLIKTINIEDVMIILLFVSIIIYLFFPTDIFVKEKVLFCHYENTIYDAVPRHQCGIVKIVSKGIHNTDAYDLISTNKTNITCYDSYYDVPSCYGENFYFTELPLRVFCVEPDCDVDGVICSANYITYINQSKYQSLFEDRWFTHKNISDEIELIELIKGCGNNG